MKVWQMKGPGTLVLVEMAEPRTGEGEVLVRVRAAGVITTELGWYPTTHTKAGGPRKDAVPGHEFAGVVAAVGVGVSGVTVGQEIYGMNDWFMEGALAEYCVTRPGWVAGKPGRLSFAEAAAVPISALTAWQGLFDRAKLQRGERVLVQGGSGGVGTFALQLARRAGARVITTAAGRNKDFLRELGAEQVIDYHTEKFEDAVRGVDVVFDAVGGETTARSWGVLRAGGRLVTITSDNAEAAEARTKAAFFIVEPKREQLAEMARLLDAGEIKTVVAAVAPFEKAAAVYAGEVKGTGRGKVVVEVT